MTHRRAAVSRVQSHVLGLLSQPLFNIIEYLCYGFYVVDIGRSDPHIHHNVVLAVHGAELAVMKPIWLPFLAQLAAVRIGDALHPRLSTGRRRIAVLVVLPVELLLSQYGTIQIDLRVQFRHV